MTEESISQEDQTTYVLCVVAVIYNPDRQHKAFYLGVKGKGPALQRQQIVATKGFVANENGVKIRIFPDMIESLTLKVHQGGEINQEETVNGSKADGTKSNQHQTTDCRGQVNPAADSDEVSG